MTLTRRPVSCCFRATEFRKDIRPEVFPCALTQKLGLTRADTAAAQREDVLTPLGDINFQSTNQKKEVVV